MTGIDSDIVAITQLVNLYGLAVDSQRWQLFDSIFTIPGVQFELAATALRREAEAGRVGVLAWSRAATDG